MVGQGATAAGPSRDHHVTAKAGQKPYGSGVDGRVQHPLGASRQQSHPHPPGTLGRVNLGAVQGGGLGQFVWRHGQHAPHPSRRQPGQGPDQARGLQGQAKQRRPGQHQRQGPAQPSLAQGPAELRLDPGPGPVQQMHVIDARGTGGHARQTRKAAVNMAHRAGIGWVACFQHVLDQIDPATGAVQFIAQQNIGWAGGGAKAAMDAFAQDTVSLSHIRIAQLRG